MIIEGQLGHPHNACIY